MIDFSKMTTSDIWGLAEQSLNDYRWASARACLDELGLRLDSAYERLQHRKRTGTFTRPCGDKLPTLRELAVTSDVMAKCYRPVIGDRIEWVNNLVEQSERDARVAGVR